jgi:hypothetical protein
MRNPGRWPALVLGALVCLFYGIIFAGQVLGFFGIYHSWIAVPLALLVCVAAGYFYFKLQPVAGEQNPDDSAFSKLDLVFGLCALVLTVLLVAVPLVLWPASPAGKTLTWDAGLYHFPKAVELFRSGSMWDMNVCYAEYPLGYESLLSFTLLLTGSAAAFGAVHFLLALFLIAALWLLARRYTRLPAGLLLLGILAVLLSGFLDKDNNPWWVYYPLIFTVGKNDLFQGAAVLAVLAFAPFVAARDNEEPAWHPASFALASMLALSIKPNSLIILPLWLLAFYRLWKAAPTRKAFLGKALLMSAVALPGVLWILRNLVALHALFTPASLKLAGWSIAGNLTNPNLTQHIPLYLYFFVAVAGLTLLLALLRRISWAAALTLAVLLLGFAVTPASAFHGSTQGRAEIAWRFAIAFISYALVLLLVVFTPLLQKLLGWAARYRAVLVVLAVGALALSGFFFWRMRQLVRSVPQNAIILQDQFEQPVGTDGYYSAYDYARRNIHDAAIIVDNGLPFYTYDAGFTNATTCSGHADYFIVFNTDWDKAAPGAYPEYVSTADWQNDWDVVYEDDYSRVYQRR